jgi:hypothetical protein
MKTIKLYCKTCGIPLTNALQETDPKNVRVGDGENALAKGTFCMMLWENNKEELIISIEENILKDHHELWRFQGCCGSDGGSGLNKLCANGHEVATEFSDCYMPHYIAIDTDRVRVEQIEDKK